MTGRRGRLAVTEPSAEFVMFRGAESTVFAALLPPRTEIRGDFIWHDCQVLDWVKGPLPAYV